MTAVSPDSAVARSRRADSRGVLSTVPGASRAPSECWLSLHLLSASPALCPRGRCAAPLWARSLWCLPGSCAADLPNAVSGTGGQSRKGNMSVIRTHVHEGKVSLIL